jgi:hypothetical protein
MAPTPISSQQGMELRFRADFFNIFKTTQTSAIPNSDPISPLKGHSTQTLASSLKSGGENGGGD